MLGVRGELQSSKKHAQLRKYCRYMLHVHVVEMGISYKEKEYLCIRETTILVDRMKVYTACRERQMEEVKLDLKNVPET